MLDRKTQSGSFDDEENEDTLRQLHRLQSLVKLASAPAQSNRASRVAIEAVTALDASACIFHRLSLEASLELTDIHQPGGLDASWLKKVAELAAADVMATGAAVQVGDTGEQYADAMAPGEADVAVYLGVPLFDAQGNTVGVMAVMRSGELLFTEDERWWLETAAHLVSSAISCELLEARLHSLEARSASGEPLSHHPSATSPAAGTETAVRRRAVLLVDDDREVHGVMRKFLVRAGYQVDSAFSGLEALNLFEPSEHGVIVSDIMMPHMNGWELVASLRKRAPELTAFLVTGYSNIGGVWNQTFLRKQGVNAVLNKPIDFKHLSGIIEDAFNAKRV